MEKQINKVNQRKICIENRKGLSLDIRNNYSHIICEKLKPYLTKYDLNSLTDAQYTKMVEITREQLTLLSDITDAVPYFFGKDVEIEPETQTGTLDTEVAQNVLKDFVSKAKDLT